jgi:hypothetical protein
LGGAGEVGATLEFMDVCFCFSNESLVSVKPYSEIKIYILSMKRDLDELKLIKSQFDEPVLKKMYF